MNNDQIHITAQDFAVAFQDNLSEFVKEKSKTLTF